MHKNDIFSKDKYATLNLQINSIKGTDNQIFKIQSYSPKFEIFFIKIQKKTFSVHGS